MEKIAVIGSGFSGLTSASLLASKGYEVDLYEKNNSLGGRARQFKAEGYTFDMGPSWYWMPEIFEDYFALFNKKSSDFYELKRLDPSYTVHYHNGEKIHVPADYNSLKDIFENIEEGSSKFLDEFLNEAEYKYKVGMEEFVWRPGHSILEFAEIRVMKSMFKLQMLSSISSQIRKNVKNDKLRQLLEFPVLFLGATPQKTPALYSLMNYADLKLGTWYPVGGMHKIIEAMVSICTKHGVTFHTNTPVEKIDNNDDEKILVQSSLGVKKYSYVIASADYHHVDQKLLPKEKKNYDSSYWNKRTMAPSSLLFYLGIDHKVKNIHHHNLFFDADFDQHAKEIYTDPKWPNNPLFYVCCPSKTDASVAPDGKENMFILIPLAPGLKDDKTKHQHYLDIVFDRLEAVVGENLMPSVEFQRTFSIDDFKSDYNAFKGNAYGLANTLSQTAFLKPKLKSKHIKNLYFTGQLTTPGPGMPPAIISGQVVANEIIHKNKKTYA